MLTLVHAHISAHITRGDQHVTLGIRGSDELIEWEHATSVYKHILIVGVPLVDLTSSVVFRLIDWF